MAEFRLHISLTPWHATLERVSRATTLEEGRPAPQRLEFFSPLELVYFLERGLEHPRSGLR